MAGISYPFFTKIMVIFLILIFEFPRDAWYVR